MSRASPSTIKNALGFFVPRTRTTPSHTQRALTDKFEHLFFDFSPAASFSPHLQYPRPYPFPFFLVASYSPIAAVAPLSISIFFLPSQPTPSSSSSLSRSRHLNPPTPWSYRVTLPFFYFPLFFTGRASLFALRQFIGSDSQA